MSKSSNKMSEHNESAKDKQLVELTAIYQQLAGLETDDMTTGNQEVISQVCDRLHIFIHKHYGIVV